MSTTVKLNPATGQVSGTHSDMPLVIIPSEITNLGSLTSAEADSCRIYSDSSLTTELAREVVSADEIHVNVSSVSSSTEIWFDYDGSRADYAVTATYGRNAVWVDYSYVGHMEGSSDAIDSSGNTDFSEVETVTSTAGVIGGGRNGFSGGNFFSRLTNVFNVSSLTIQGWHNISSFNNGIAYTFPDDSLNGIFDNWVQFQSTGSSIRFGLRNTSGTRVFFNTTGSYSTSVNYLLHFTYDGSTMRVHANATQDPTTASHSGVINDGTRSKQIGEAGGASFNGLLDEVRFRESALSANWITTEYNNQNDNAAFWEATDVSGGGGGGATFIPKVSMIA